MCYTTSALVAAVALCKGSDTMNGVSIKFSLFAGPRQLGQDSTGKAPGDQDSVLIFVP